MDNETISNVLQFMYNESDIQPMEFNATVKFMMPAMTIEFIIICSLGILENSLIIAVIVFTSLMTSVFMNLVMMLAISDNLCLLTQLNAQPDIFGSIITPTLLHCRLTIYNIYTSSILSSWITVLIAVERYIAVAFPLKVHVYCTKTRTYLTLLLIVVLTCIGLAPILSS